MTHIVDHMVQRYVEGYVREAHLLPNGMLTVKHPWLAHHMPELKGITMRTIPSPSPSLYDLMADLIYTNRTTVEGPAGIRRLGKLPELALPFSGGQGGRGNPDQGVYLRNRVTKDHTK